MQGTSDLTVFIDLVRGPVPLRKGVYSESDQDLSRFDMEHEL